MTKFRKRPVVIEAVLCGDVLAALKGDRAGIPHWLAELLEKGLAVSGPSGIVLATPEGNMTAQKTDWIIRGIKTEVYPCKPDIFAATYEAVS
jgi:hypothetical protein